MEINELIVRHAFVKIDNGVIKEEINLILSDKSGYNKTKIFERLNKEWETAPKVAIWYNTTRNTFQSYRFPDNRDLENIDKWFQDKIDSKITLEGLGDFAELIF